MPGIAGQDVEFSFIQSYTLFINHERNRNRKNSIFSTMRHKDKRRRFLVKPHVDGVVLRIVSSLDLWGANFEMY